MFFLPYRFDLGLRRVPWLTLLASLLCIAVYTQQFLNEQEYFEKTSQFCAAKRPNLERMVFEKAIGDSGSYGCELLMQELTVAEDANLLIDEYADNSVAFVGLTEDASRDYVRQVLRERYRSYRATVPAYRTRELWYAPESWNPWTMLTSSFSHGDWSHLIGNLVFFYAFAAAVEVVIGSAAFFIVIVSMAFGTNVAYSLAMQHVADPLPTVGLSGIVMGMLALLAYLLPTAKIRCFYWFLIRIGTVAVSVWILALLYLGFDIYTLMTEEELGGVNLVAHVSGGIMGLLLGPLFFRGRKREVGILDRATRAERRGSIGTQRW